jgi:hypothetical protein
MFFRLHLIRAGASVRPRTDAPTTCPSPDRTVRHRSQSRVGVRLVCSHRRRVQRRARGRDDRGGGRYGTAVAHRLGRASGRLRDRRRRSRRSVDRRSVATRALSSARSSNGDRRSEPSRSAAESAVSSDAVEDPRLEPRATLADREPGWCRLRRRGVDGRSSRTDPSRTSPDGTVGYSVPSGGIVSSSVSTRANSVQPH